MSNQTIKTPCIGLCSTVYGDLVCRGCKRFHHEVIQWNGYGEEENVPYGCGLSNCWCR